MPSRDKILHRLRAILARDDLRFPPQDPEPLGDETRMAVTQARGGGPELAARFRQELTKLHGSCDVVSSPAEARLGLINRLIAWQKEESEAAKGARLQTGQEKQVLGWGPDALPIDHLAESLADMGFELVTPATLESPESRESVRHIRFGLTGVEAAFAATGSMLLLSGPQRPLTASLLPARHVALIPITRLYPTIEVWLAERREKDLATLLRAHANLTLITGPSRSADIEMQLTLGVHGPRHVHAIIFDDGVGDDATYDSFWRYVPQPTESRTGSRTESPAERPAWSAAPPAEPPPPDHTPPDRE